MPFTVTPVVAGASAKSWQVDSSADADEFVDIPHGFGVIPLFVTTSDISVSVAQNLADKLASWAIDRAATDAVNVRVRKGTEAGSGGSSCLVVIPIPVR
jgi:hypothetical protein